MTINGVITDLQRANREGCSLEAVARWCAAVDGMVAEKLWAGDAAPEAAETDYRYPDDGDRELLIGGAWERVYFYYVCAMIDLAKRQYEDYNNMIDLYNELYQDYARHHRRTHEPRDSGGIKCG